MTDSADYILSARSAKSARAIIPIFVELLAEICFAYSLLLGSRSSKLQTVCQFTINHYKNYHSSVLNEETGNPPALNNSALAKSFHKYRITTGFFTLSEVKTTDFLLTTVFAG